MRDWDPCTFSKVKKWKEKVGKIKRQNDKGRARKEK